MVILMALIPHYRQTQKYKPNQEHLLTQQMQHRPLKMVLQVFSDATRKHFVKHKG